MMMTTTVRMMKMSMMRMMTASGPWAAISVIGKGGLHRPSQKSELSHFLTVSSLSIYHHYPSYPSIITIHPSIITMAVIRMLISNQNIFISTLKGEESRKAFCPSQTFGWWLLVLGTCSNFAAE